MGNCASGPKTKEGPAPEPATAKEETIVKGTEEVKMETGEKIEERDVDIKTDEKAKTATENAQTFVQLLDSDGNQAEEVKAEVKEEKEEQAEAKPAVEEQPKTEEVKVEEPKESSEAGAPADPTKDEVEKKE